ncbi:MAG: cadherin-like beta sandwich domain-containing protein [Paludibacteraceae bacterium]|nr:cadherin-like beta sandwich domain-containing protein [Paludibacteraceae bacterium]
MKHFYAILVTTLSLGWVTLPVMSQQLPNSNFEDWSGTPFKNVAQPASWNYSNVTQLGFEFNFAHRETGRNGGSCMMVQDQALEVAGIGETSPGYVALGHPWVYLEGLTKVNEATAGTYGGINWTHRPDTMEVWIKRTGDHWRDEDFHLLYYSWTGTAKGEKYKGKNGSCTSVSKTDEESDIRINTNGNECGTVVPANQVAEGWYRARAQYTNWTCIKVPVYYMNNAVPEKVNVIFSASNYPNFRANDGLYEGNSLYVDDVRLIYSSRIQQLFVGGQAWPAFDPNSTDVQIYPLPVSVTTIPAIKAFRGIGQLTNTKGATTDFIGRQLQGSEISIQQGVIDETPTRITVTAEDGSSQTVYQILFTHPASSNAYLSGIKVNGTDVPNFSPYISSYTVDVPFGLLSAPVVAVTKQEDKQTVSFTQPASIQDVTEITVTAADRVSQQTYTLSYREAPLSDNTLAGILVNGNPLPDFAPTKTNYNNVSIPLGTTQMPTVQALSKYADGAQTIQLVPPAQIDGGTYQIQVSTPGNPTPKVYKLTFKLEPSSYCKLRDIQLDGVSLSGFHADTTSYAVTLPMGTTQLPEITYTAGDSYQTISMTTGGIDGITRITVVAANGDRMVYKIAFSTLKSSVSTLRDILLDGVSVPDFAPLQTAYQIALEDGKTDLPDITVVKGDEYQRVVILKGDLHTATRITVTAGDGSVTTYQLTFQVKQLSDPSLAMIKVGGQPLADFQSDRLSYDYELPKGTTELPAVTYEVRDAYQKVTTRSEGVNGDYKIIVRAQNGATLTYVIHFSVPQSSNTALQMIYLDGQPLSAFSPDILDYTDTLDISTFPAVTYLAEAGQKIISVLDDNVHTIKVTAENGASRVYTVTFVVRKSESAFLKMIYLNNDSLDGFQPDRLIYSNLYLSSSTCPRITVDSEEGQQVSITTPYGEGEAQIVVTAAAGGSNTYLLQFLDTAATPIQPLDPDTPYVESADATLSTILVNGEPLAEFTNEQHDYTLNLPAGTPMPAVTFVPHTDLQSVAYGATAYGHFAATVTAENGDVATYTVAVQIADYADAYLQDLQVFGHELNFQPTTFAYALTIDKGHSLPQLTYTGKAGQHILQYDNTDTQSLIVTAQDGTTNTYVITYARKVSSVALLSDILIDGESLSDFDPQRHAYTVPLEWRTTVVPVVNAIGEGAGQTITTYFSAVNHTTTIHVVAQDGVTTADYTLSFPVQKSSNTALNEMYLETEYAVDLSFDPDQTDYTITLPADATMSPRILFAKSEKEQSISYTAQPIGLPNTITVTAENGDTRTYTVTFVRAPFEATNLLQSIYVVETSSFLDMTDVNKRDFDVVLPFGTRTLTVNYTKQYAGQTVLVQPGGVDRPTVLTVLSNHASLPDVVYTIHPVLAEDPAVLTDIQVNNTSVSHFDSHRFSYVVPITATPIVRYTAAQGATVNVLQQTIKHWQAEVTVDDRKNVYDIWYYYPDDVIPNNEFTNWTTAKYNNGPKPVAWQVVADAVEKEGTYKSGGEVKQDPAGVAYLYSRYPGLFGVGGIIPGFITLGTVTGKLGVAGSSTFQVTGGVPFHNTPDVLSIRYKAPTISDNNRIVYQLTGSNGLKELIHNDTKAIKDYTTLNMDLTSITAAAGTPSMMNIILNSYYQESGTIADGSAEMYVDWVRFGYNSSLKSILVNGDAAVKSGNTFTYEASDTEDSRLPQLTFVGEVEDQAQRVVWSAETVDGEYAVRSAAVRNYAENGDSTDYTLLIQRPLVTANTLSKLMVNNAPLSDFKPLTNNYTVTLQPGERIPDIYPYPVSAKQTVTTTLTGNVVTITVQPESGEANIYTLTITYALSSNAQLANITGLDGFAPDIYDYTIDAETLPDMNFVKAEDIQTVCMTEGTFVVTAANGAQQTYTVTLRRPTPVTSGQLSALMAKDEPLPNFRSDLYEYSGALPEWMSFVRRDDADSVIYTRTDEQMTWRVIGTDEHTYTWSAAVAPSSSTALSAIQVNGLPLEGFDAQVHDYTLYTESEMDIRVISEPKQSVVVTQNESVYTIAVTAADGTIGQPYTLAVLPPVSSDASLQAIELNGVLLPNFQSDSLVYRIVLPTPAAKQHEPVLPSIRLVPASDRASVEIELGGLGETTYIIVTAQDGIHTAEYELLFEADPSHNATLSAISVNGNIVEHFEPSRHYYSVMTTAGDIALDWRSLDRFQTVTPSITGNQCVLHVVAQDGVTTADYTIDCFTQALSDDAMLSMIWLDDKDMSTFYPELNPDLSFSPGQNRYTINMPVGMDILPNISATLRTNGQKTNIQMQGTLANIDVTAPDGVTHNIYTLSFVGKLSQNTDLKMIYIDGDSLPDFASDRRLYFVDMSVGASALPEVYPIKSEKAQQIDTVWTDSPVGKQLSLTVVAEDSKYTSTYVLLFRPTLSTVDTLQMLYADDVPMPDFRARQWNYTDTLAADGSFPVVSWEKGDAYQTVRVDTLVHTAFLQACRYTVIAENGSMNTYSVTYMIIPSPVDTLQMIFLNGDSLADFRSSRAEYVYTLPSSAVERPALHYTPGDKYQQVQIIHSDNDLLPHSLGTDSICVTAQNGAERRYVVHFPLAYSSDTTLAHIYSNGMELPRFDEQIMSYKVQLGEADTYIPAITWTKNHPAQNVDLVLVNDLCIQLRVMAEDAVHTAVYTISFLPYRSSDNLLRAIYLDDLLIPDFEPVRDSYELTVDSLAHLPQITWEALSTQQVTTDTAYTYTEDQRIREVYYTIHVLAEDSSANAYGIRFYIKSNMPVRPEDSDNARLQTLCVDGKLLGTEMGFSSDFCPDTLDYYLVYPVGSDPDAFFSAEAVTCIAQDSLAKVITPYNMQVLATAEDTAGIAVPVKTCIHITVLAPNGNQQTYNIYQTLLLDSLNRTTSLLVADLQGTLREINHFEANTFYYEYMISNTRNNAPNFALEFANTTSRFAWARFERGNDCHVVEADDDNNYAFVEGEDDPTFHLTYRAENGTRYVYKIKFRKSDIKRTDKPLAGDVLVQHIRGSYQIAVASLRANVFFALYDMNGTMIDYRMLEESDPSNFNLVTDGFGQTYFGSLSDYSSCTILTLQPSKTYFWAFLEQGKRPIRSGKIVIVP